MHAHNHFRSRAGRGMCSGQLNSGLYCTVHYRCIMNGGSCNLCITEWINFTVFTEHSETEHAAERCWLLMPGSYKHLSFLWLCSYVLSLQCNPVWFGTPRKIFSTNQTMIILYHRTFVNSLHGETCSLGASSVQVNIFSCRGQPS